MSTTTETNTALEQARAQTSAIVELVAALVAAEATGDDNATAAARQAINESPLSLEVRSGWTIPGQPMANASLAASKGRTGAPLGPNTGPHPRSTKP